MVSTNARCPNSRNLKEADRHMNLHGKVWRPPTDVYETADAIVVRVEAAGMTEGDFNVDLVRRTLVINGRRQDRSPSKLAYQQMEISYGEFRTEVLLPCSVNAAGVEATYRDGFLVVTLPKADVLRVPISNLSAAKKRDERALGPEK
jgi:HSP20 family protein